MSRYPLLRSIASLITIGCLSACVSLRAGPTVSTNLVSKSSSNVAGTIVFTQLLKGTDIHGVEIAGSISGLKPNQLHGFHIHEKGDCSSADATSAGGHFNPDGKKHGNHEHHSHSNDHHAGDMPNLKADANGVAKFNVILQGITIDKGPNSIKGRAVVVHANEDDYVSQPVGNAGARIACGSIL
jgi:superoxide dismutase, Cu-Zn family